MYIEPDVFKGSELLCSERLTMLKMMILYAVLLALLPTGYGHSWVERLYRLANGTLVGVPGFPRGNG